MIPVGIDDDEATVLITSLAVPSGQGLYGVVTEPTTARTLALPDAQKYIRCTSLSDVTITIPQQSSVAWPTGTEIYIEQASIGQVTCVAGTGATLRSSQTAATAGQYAVITLKRVGVNSWVCLGDRAAGSMPSDDTVAAAFLTATGITDDTIEGAIEQHVSDLRNANLLSKAIAIWPFVGGTAATHKYNLVNPLNTDAGFRLTFTGTWSHDANGVTPGGSDSHINTFVNLNTAAAQYSKSTVFYSRSNTAPVDAVGEAVSGGRGASGAGTYIAFYNTTRIDLSNGQTNLAGSPQTLNETSYAGRWDGFWCESQCGFNCWQLYRNAVLVKELVSTVFGYYSDGDPSQNKTQYISARNANGTTEWRSPKPLSYFAFFDGILPDEQEPLFDIMQDFQTALGRQV